MKLSPESLYRPWLKKAVKTLATNTPFPAPEPFVSFSALKDRIRHHYEVVLTIITPSGVSTFTMATSSTLQTRKKLHKSRLISLLLEKSALPASSTVLDVGCGIGGTSRYLAREKGCQVTGVTISARQVEIATKLSAEEASSRNQEAEILTNGSDEASPDGSIKLGKLGGSVKFIELDAEKMGEYFHQQEV